MAASQYITGTQLAIYYDVRRLCEMASDTGTPIDPATIDTNPVIVEAIRAASAEIDSACRVGQRYSLATLALIAADGTTTGGVPLSGGLLRALTAGLAYGVLAARRGLSEIEADTFRVREKQTRQTLELLRLGERIFEDGVSPDAGLPSVALLGGGPFALGGGGGPASLCRIWGTVGARRGGYGGFGGGCGCG